MKTLSVLLALCKENALVSGVFPSRMVNCVRGFDGLFLSNRNYFLKNSQSACAMILLHANVTSPQYKQNQVSWTAHVNIFRATAEHTRDFLLFLSITDAVNISWTQHIRSS